LELVAALCCQIALVGGSMGNVGAW